MVHQSIKVYARIRRGSPGKLEQYNIITKKEYENLIFSNIYVSPATFNQGFRFHKIFDKNTSQPEIFETLAKPVICSVIEGFNGTIFAYGQTGSGKTFTINGSSKEYSQRGIIPRSIQYIFDHYTNIPEKPTIYISYMEIYNEIGYDLLSTKQQNVAKTLEELPRVFVMEDKKGDAHLRNLSVYPVTTEEDAMRLLFMGDTNRTIAETPYNEYSSRSHCIFTVYITHRSNDSKNLRSSKLHLVDLAGSERDYKNNCSGVVVHEAKFINLSLYFLQQVILALSESKRSHVPYRNSMLTHILKDSLNGNCITTMLATLSLSKENFQETLSTCRFAQRVALITTNAVINEITDPEQEIGILRMRIQELETQLSKSITFSNTTILSSQQKENCQLEVNSFINSDKKPIAVEPDMTQIQFCFSLLKKELDKKRNELTIMENLVKKKKSEIGSLNAEMIKKNAEIDKLKNVIDRIADNPVSLCATSQICINSVDSSYQKSKDELPLLNWQDQKSLEDFMSKPGISDDLNFYKSALQNKLKLAKIYADTIEECKRKITFIRNKLDNKNKTEEEKQNLIKDLEEQQRLYKKGLVEMKQIQNETNHLEAGLKQAEIRVVHKFQNWLEDKNLPNQIYSYLEEKTSPHNSVLKPAEKPNYGIVPTVVTKEKEHQNYALKSKPVVVRLYDRKMQPVKISKVSIQSNDNLSQNSKSFTNVSTDKSKNIDDLDYFESISSIKNVTKPNTIQEIISQRVEKASCKSDGDSSRESIQPSKLSDTIKFL
ncbi:unnamed protein product [Psylliodes chrysocephalus]|uniref:Kinesin-like protein n=1 Tax=Psylliodes chrysocephalus TaxID=3402493 RepID=A0A9P0CUN3_9CUCU|nr:unnamed protein product [Psylliodes chrysocephala]